MKDPMRREVSAVVSGGWAAPPSFGVARKLGFPDLGFGCGLKAQFVGADGLSFWI